MELLTSCAKVTIYLTYFNIKRCHFRQNKIMFVSDQHLHSDHWYEIILFGYRYVKVSADVHANKYNHVWLPTELSFMLILSMKTRTQSGTDWSEMKSTAKSIFFFFQIQRGWVIFIPRHTTVVGYYGFTLVVRVSGHSNKRVLMWLSRVIWILMWLFYSYTSRFLATQFKIFMCLRNKSIGTVRQPPKYSWVCTDVHLSVVRPSIRLYFRFRIVTRVTVNG